MRLNTQVHFSQDSKCLYLVNNGSSLSQSLRYCRVCNIYRPFRSIHCYQCHNCVVSFDHHCLWLGTCIGHRNYLYVRLFLLWYSWFTKFLWTLLCWITFILISTATEIYQIREELVHNEIVHSYFIISYASIVSLKNVVYHLDVLLCWLSLWVSCSPYLPQFDYPWKSKGILRQDWCA
jgi:hypothetical protein